MPQWSTWGPLLFYIHLNDLFFLAEYTDVYNFMDDTTFHARGKDLNSLINWLDHGTLLAIEWFENNNMKLNRDKCHLILSGLKYENVFASTDQLINWETEN